MASLSLGSALCRPYPSPPSIAASVTRAAPIALTFASTAKRSGWAPTVLSKVANDMPS